MTFNEILLIVVVMSVMITTFFLLKRIKQPIITYIRLTSGLLLLILVWFSAGGSQIPMKLILITVVIYSAIKTIKDYMSFSRHTKSWKS